MAEIEELHSVVVSIIKDSNVTVEINDELPTAVCNYLDRKIILTRSYIPENLKKFKRVVSRILDGQAVHEAGHFLLSKPIHKSREAWKAKKDNKELAERVMNIVDDVRIDHFIMLRYQYDFGKRRKFVRDLLTKIVQDSYDSETKRMDESWIPEFVVGFSLLKAKFPDLKIPKHVFKKLQKEDLEVITRVGEICESAKFHKTPMSIVKDYEEVYQVLYNYLVRKGSWSRARSSAFMEFIPTSEGGHMELKASKELEGEVEKIEVELQKGEEAEQGEEGEEKGHVMAVGSGSGLQIPAPQPNIAEYQRLVQANEPYIQELLRLLKTTVRPKLIPDKFKRHGRLMSEIIGKAYASSTRRPVNNIYARKTLQIEKTPVCMCLIVDLSGSMSEWEAKNVLTVIAEVMGRWLRDEDFAIIIFGSEYQKIKVFVEKWNNTKARIGGVQCLGGTVMAPVLEEVHKMFLSVKNHRKKICIVVSDFWVSNEEECRKQIEAMEKDGISVLGVGLCDTDLERVKWFVKEDQATYVNHIAELPRKIAEIYMKVAF